MIAGVKAKRGESDAASWLHHLLALLAWQAAKDARRFASAPGEATHALRVRMKKIGAVLHLAADKPKKGKTGGLLLQARAIKEAVAVGRDEHVIAKLARELKIASPPSPSARHAAAPCPSGRLREQCGRLLSGVRSLVVDELRWKDVKRRHRRAARRAEESCRRCAKSHDADAFHEWRKRVKTLYYQSLALHDSADANGRLRRMAKLAHKLGDEHDLSLLAGRLGEGADRRRVEKKRRKLHERLRKLGRRIFGDDGGK